MSTLQEKQQPDSFETALTALCETLAEEAKPFYHSDLQPYESVAGYLKEKVREQIIQFKNSFINASLLIFEHIVSKKPAAEQEVYKIFSLAEHFQAATAELTEQETLQDVLGYTDEMLSEIDRLAKRFQKEGEHQKSLDLYIFLATLNPYAGTFWQNMGHSLQALHRPDEAFYTYILALNCMPYEIPCYRNAARCCLDEKNYEGALNILNYGLEVFRKAEDQTQLRDFEHKLNAMVAYTEKLKRGGSS